jgi:CubicO group peptidase (beta-lactamase class C family)
MPGFFGGEKVMLRNQVFAGDRPVIVVLYSLLGLALLFWLPTSRADDRPAGEVLAADTPATTVRGNRFTAPAEWRLSARGSATLIEAPEEGSRIVLVDVEADGADEALAKGWQAYRTPGWEIKGSNERADADGWTKRRNYDYQVSPNEKRGVAAGVMYANDLWTVWIYDMADEVGGKRGAQVNLVFSSLYPKGYSPESFAEMTAHELDEKRLAELTGFVESAMQQTGVPGVGLGIIQNGKVVFAGGLGVRELGKPKKVDDETLFMVASNTKAMTTLLLARQVDAGKLEWTTPVTDLMPDFRLGSEETTARTRVEHLICACTGLPRKDMELILEFDGLAAADAMKRLASTQPTSDFGEMFQYSNSLAAAAGFVAGHVQYPEMELGAAYDMAMQGEVFDRLGMKATTFDYARAQAGNFASAHGTGVDGETAIIPMEINYAVEHVRPAGAAWSNVNDMLRYIAMELDEGVLPSGERYISSNVLLERRAKKVSLSQDAVYGMGLIIDRSYDVEVVHHGGDVFGHHSDMMWLPGHRVGAIVMTSGDPGCIIRGHFRRKLLEVLFDGKPDAQAAMEADARRYFERIAADRKLYDIPADADAAKALATRYHNGSLGNITVKRELGITHFDFGEWASEVASRTNPDGTVSFITIGAGRAGFEFVVVAGDKRQLIMRDAQHEYVFDGV